MMGKHEGEGGKRDGKKFRFKPPKPKFLGMWMMNVDKLTC